MQREPAYLLDILNSAMKAVEYVNGKTLDEFLEDSQNQDAVIRRIEIIGEAAGRINQDFQNQYPELPWKEMKAMRNLLIHEYDDVDAEEVWKTVKTDLPELIRMLQEIIPSL